MPYFTPLCGIISTIVAAMAGLFVVIETGLVPVSGFGGFPGHGSFVLFPSFVPRRPAVIPAAMPINLQRGDAVFFTDASSGFLSADYIRDVTKKLSARTPRAVVDSSVMSSRAVIPAAMPVDLACGDAVVSSGPSSGFSAESGKTLSSVEDRSPASSALAPAAMPAAHNGVCSAFSSPFFSAANDGDMPHMSSVQTVSPVDDSSPASSALALVETPVNLASDDDDDEVFFSTANDLFPVESTDSAFVVAAFQPLPAPLAVNFTADPRKPTSSTTATPPPPINPTRYPGSLDYLWWYLLRTIFALMRLLAYWVYNYQSALTRHYVIPPTQPVAVIKKRAAGNSGGEQETEAEIVQVYGESIRQDWPWKSGVKFPKANSPAAPPSPSSPAVSPVASPAVSPATLPLGSSPAASPAASPSPSSPAVSPVAPSAVSSAESRAGSPAASPAALPLVSSPVVSPVASSAPSPAVLPLVSPPAVSPVASPTASPTPSPAVFQGASPAASPPGSPTASPAGSPVASPAVSPPFRFHSFPPPSRHATPTFSLPPPAYPTTPKVVSPPVETTVPSSPAPAEPTTPKAASSPVKTPAPSTPPSAPANPPTAGSRTIKTGTPPLSRIPVWVTPTTAPRTPPTRMPSRAPLGYQGSGPSHWPSTMTPAEFAAKFPMHGKRRDQK